MSFVDDCSVYEKNKITFGAPTAYGCLSLFLIITTGHPFLRTYHLISLLTPVSLCLFFDIFVVVATATIVVVSAAFFNL